MGIAVTPGDSLPEIGAHYQTTLWESFLVGPYTISQLS
jgi:hypothetical protein